MERAVEGFVAITSFVIGCSHIIRPSDWVDLYSKLRHMGRPAAFINGAANIVPGAVIVAAHNIWSWPAALLTVFGWLIIAKSLICFIAPDTALRSMTLATAANFRAAGIALLGIGGWAVFCLLNE